MSGEFITVWNFDDYVAANRLIQKNRRKQTWLIALGAITVGIFMSDPFHSDLAEMGLIFAFGVPMLIGLLACFLGFWLVDRFLIPYQSRRRYDQLKIDGTNIRFEFDASGIRMTSPLGSSNLEWQHFTRWTENDHLLMMFRTPLLFYAAPKSQIAPKRSMPFAPR